MAFRDDVEAQRQRSAALEDEVRRLESKNRELESQLSVRTAERPSGSGSEQAVDESPASDAVPPSRDPLVRASREAAWRARIFAFFGLAAIFAVVLTVEMHTASASTLAVWGGELLVFAAFEALRAGLVHRDGSNWGYFHGTLFRLGRCGALAAVAALVGFAVPGAAMHAFLAGTLGTFVGLVSFSMPEEMIW